MNNLYYKIIFLIIVSELIISQSINGFVREEKTGEPISYANVFLSNTTLGSATNRDGYFVIKNVPEGSYEINVTMIGYGVYKNEIKMSKEKSTRLEIYCRTTKI